jgi:hypothetical protein
MTKQTIRVGASANDKTGDTIRAAFVKVNANFTELYNSVGPSLIPSQTGNADKYLKTDGTTLSWATVSSGTTDYNNLTNKPSLFSGSYTDLTNKPTIPAAQIQSDWTQASNVALDFIKNKPALFSGSYTDLTNKPTIPAAATWPVTNTNNEFGPTRIAIGNSAGNIAQGSATVAVGSFAGNDTQGGAAVAIGTYAGTTTQRNDAIAIGYLTGNDVQGTGAVSIGRQAGQTSQGAYSIAIGKLAGQTSQAANTIILNSTNSALNGVAAQTNSFYVSPIRTDATPSNVLFYNTTTKEITYGSAPSATVSSLVNGARTVSLGSDGTLTLPAQAATLTNVNQIVSAKIYRAGASTDTGTIQTALDNWMGYEQAWLDLRGEDAQINAGQSARPWAGMPSYTAYPIILNYQPTGSQLPVPGNMPPTAKAASDAYLTYKELQRNIDIVAGDNTFSFENTGALRVPGVITKNNNLTLVSAGTTVFQGLSDQGLPVEVRNDLTAAVVADGEYGRVFIRTDNGTTLRTWQFDANGGLTLPGGGVISEGGEFTGAIRLTPAGGANANQALVIYPTATAPDGDHLHLTAGGGTTELYLGNDNQYVKLVNGGNIQVQAFQPTSPYASSAWTFGTDGSLALPNAAVIGQASDVEITAASTSYTNSLAIWEGVRASYQAQANNLGVTSAGWPFIAWSATGPTAAGLIAQLTTAWQIQQGAPTSPPTPLIFQPPISVGMYQEIRTALVTVRDSYTTWQALLTSVEITAGGESVTLLSNGKLQVPNIIQTDPEEDLVIRTRYAVASSPPGTPAYANRNFTFGTNGNLTLETGIASAGGSLWITPQSAVSSKRFNFNVNSSGATFISAWLEMPWAENNKQVGQQFYHNNGTIGYLWNQGTDSNVTNLNNAFNMFANGTDIKLTAQDSSSTQFTWTFAKDGTLTVPGSIIGTATQDVFNTTSTTVNAFGAATTLNIGASGGTTTIAGNLTVNGTTTTINSTTISVDDKNIELGSVATPTNTTADGGGITLKGDTDKTIIWDSANSNWTSSEHWNIASGKSYKINNVAVLSASAVLASATGVTVGGTGTTTIALGTNTTATNTVTVGGAIDGNTLKVAGTTTGTINLTTDVTSGTVNIFTSATGTITIGTAGSGIVGFAKTATTSSTASSLGYLGLPQSATNTSTTLAIGDAGKHIYVNTASQTMTIPANGTVAYPIGTTLTFIAGPSATTVSIAITTDTMYLAGTGTTGTRTLAAHGMATAVKVAATTWYINGTGLT